MRIHEDLLDQESFTSLQANKIWPWNGIDKFLLELKSFQGPSLVHHHQQTCSTFWEFRVLVQMLVLQHYIAEKQNVFIQNECGSCVFSSAWVPEHVEATALCQMKWLLAAKKVAPQPPSVASAASLDFCSATLATVPWVWLARVEFCCLNRLWMGRLQWHLPCNPRKPQADFLPLLVCQQSEMFLSLAGISSLILVKALSKYPICYWRSMQV